MVASSDVVESWSELGYVSGPLPSRSIKLGGGPDRPSQELAERAQRPFWAMEKRRREESL